MDQVTVRRIEWGIVGFIFLAYLFPNAMQHIIAFYIGFVKGFVLGFLGL